MKSNYKSRSNPHNPPLVLMRKLAGQNLVVRIGDVVVTPQGKPAVVTGWDDINGIVHATTMCEQKYFMSVPSSVFNCWFAEA